MFLSPNSICNIPNSIQVNLMSPSSQLFHQALETCSSRTSWVRWQISTDRELRKECHLQMFQIMIRTNLLQAKLEISRAISLHQRKWPFCHKSLVRKRNRARAQYWAGIRWPALTQCRLTRVFRHCLELPKASFRQKAHLQHSLPTPRNWLSKINEKTVLWQLTAKPQAMPFQPSMRAKRPQEATSQSLVSPVSRSPHLCRPAQLAPRGRDFKSITVKGHDWLWPKMKIMLIINYKSLRGRICQAKMTATRYLALAHRPTTLPLLCRSPTLFQSLSPLPYARLLLLS